MSALFDMPARSHASLAVLLVGLCLGACSSPSPGETALGVDGAGGTHPTGSGGAGAMASGGDWSGTPDAGTTRSPVKRRVPVPLPADGTCEAGGQYECTCADGAKGIQVCTDPSGVLTACGCETKYPWPGQTCGSNECGYLVNDGEQFTGAHCCTADGKCGVGNDAAFGSTNGAMTCFAAGVEPPGVVDEEQCVINPIPFVQTEPCCRPDGKCGLRLLEGSNWDELGCVERVDLMQRLKASTILWFFLTFVKGVPGALDGYTGAACVYPAKAK